MHQKQLFDIAFCIPVESDDLTAYGLIPELAGRPYYPVRTGRRDSKESFFDKAMAEIPRPNGNIIETLIDYFRSEDLMRGKQLGNFMGTGLPDPTIPPDFVEELRRKCPDDNNTISNMLNDEDIYRYS
ncbi:hypothetical protein H5410_008569 [Solanum commersonii]|uniref:Plant heme peroxidase family profile domain-containing protein n=1 Tax=Solanum commersonii TaxID=4109 RepID=A0A9J6AH61_SOLCO|nr:hypothetical protein H5410_008569 [Solanum commersonii]